MHSAVHLVVMLLMVDVVVGDVFYVPAESSSRGNLYCMMDKLGLEYHGKQNLTKSGKTCQYWSFQQLSTTDGENYCRNPDQSPNGPWCYTTGGQREDCNIPLCVFPDDIVPIISCSFNHNGVDINVKLGESIDLLDKNGCGYKCEKCTKQGMACARVFNKLCTSHLFHEE